MRRDVTSHLQTPEPERSESGGLWPGLRLPGEAAGGGGIRGPAGTPGRQAASSLSVQGRRRGRPRTRRGGWCQVIVLVRPKLPGKPAPSAAPVSHGRRLSSRRGRRNTLCAFGAAAVPEREPTVGSRALGKRPPAQERSAKAQVPRAALRVRNGVGPQSLCSHRRPRTSSQTHKPPRTAAVPPRASGRRTPDVRHTRPQALAGSRARQQPAARSPPLRAVSRPVLLKRPEQSPFSLARLRTGARTSPALPSRTLPRTLQPPPGGPLGCLRFPQCLRTPRISACFSVRLCRTHLWEWP